MLRASRRLRTKGARARRSQGRILLTGALACVACGLVGIASILLTPRPAVSSAPSVEVSDLEPGTFKFVRHPIDGPSGSRTAKADILFARRADGHLVALHIPVKDGVRHSPDGATTIPRWPCHRFEVRVARGEIECESESALALDERISRWDFEGRGIAPTWSRLEKVTGHEESGTFLIHP